MDRVQRPTPQRPGVASTVHSSERDAESHPGRLQRLRSSRSVADLGGLSRSASFLSFAGLAETSSALFGIFERGGYTSPDDPAAAATAPVTPDGSPRLPDGVFSMAPEQKPRQRRIRKRSGGRQALIKSGGVFVAAYLFIALFNKLPKNNTFCKAITSQDVPCAPYALAATLVSLLVPFLDEALSNTNQPTLLQQEPQHEHRPLYFNSLIRYFAGFLGVAYAGTKLDYNDAATFNTCCFVMTLGYIFWVDGTWQGFAIISILSILGTSAWAAGVALMAASGAAVEPYTKMTEVVSAGVLIGLNVSVWGTMGKLWQRAR